MTDHLAEARAAIHAEHGWSMAAPASSLADMAYAIARILDHLEAQQTAASIRRGLDDVAAGRTEHLGRFADDDRLLNAESALAMLGDEYGCSCHVLPEPEPEPDPLDETNHADRYDGDGVRWVWCVECDGLRQGHYCGEHRPGLGWTAAEIDERYGPLTFAHRPAEPPTAAPQPDEAHGDAPNPARPAETHTDNIRAEAWDEGYQAGLTEMYHDNPYRKARA